MSWQTFGLLPQGVLIAVAFCWSLMLSASLTYPAESFFAILLLLTEATSLQEPGLPTFFSVFLKIIFFLMLSWSTNERGSFTAFMNGL
jgi:hypothetical protein